MTFWQKKYLIPAVFITAFFIIAFAYYWFWQTPKQPEQVVPEVNHLIAGVPYYGIYNHFFGTFSKPRPILAASVASILGYWGDNRFSLKDLTEQFPPDKFFNSEEIYKFFEDNGYERGKTGGVGAKEGLAISRIKMFVNPQRNIPIIVYQALPSFPDLPFGSHRVVIGLFDKNEKVVVHDFNFGNNYEISYADFEKLFQPNKGAIMAVWPSADLTSSLKRELSPPPYPKRIEAMDKLGPLLIKRNEVLSLVRDGQYDRAIEIQREIVNDPAFSYFHPAYKVFFLSMLAKYFLLAGQPDETINLINSKILALNNNLTEPYADWPDQIEGLTAFEDKMALPFRLLGQAYLEKGNKELARKNFEQALKIDPNDEKSQEALESLK